MFVEFQNNLKQLSEDKLKKKKYGDIFKVQLQEIGTVVDPSHEELDWWDPKPYAPTDPDDLDREEDYPDVPAPKNTQKKKTEPFGNGFYITVIICLILLIVFLVWLFFSLAKRVKKMSSNSIDYNMFNGQVGTFK